MKRVSTWEGSDFEWDEAEDYEDLEWTLVKYESPVHDDDDDGDLFIHAWNRDGQKLVFRIHGPVGSNNVIGEIQPED